MQLGKAFSYQFEDPDWAQKLWPGALVSLVPILNLAVSGYMVRALRNVAAGVERPLPRWDDLGGLFVDGFLLTLAGIIYAAPLLLVILVPLGFLAASWLWNSESLRQLQHLLAGFSAVALAGLLILLLFYGLLLSLLRPAIMVIFSRDGTFASCFKLGEILGLITKHTRSYLSAWLAMIAAGLVIGLVLGFGNVLLGWIPCIGWLVSMGLALGSAIYVITVEAHLFGQFRAEALGRAHRGQESAAETQQNPGDLSP